MYLLGRSRIAITGILILLLDINKLIDFFLDIFIVFIGFLGRLVA